jgi:hypothetical protein
MVADDVALKLLGDAGLGVRRMRQKLLVARLMAASEAGSRVDCMQPPSATPNTAIRMNVGLRIDIVCSPPAFQRSAVKAT